MPDKARSLRARKHFPKSSPELRKRPRRLAARLSALEAMVHTADSVEQLAEIRLRATAIQTRAGISELNKLRGSSIQRTANRRLKEMSNEERDTTQAGPPPVAKTIPPFHPLAAIFPLIEGKDFDELVASIKASNGPREDIILHKAIDQARVGVAMFAQLRWLETIGRYERLFRDHPPTQIAFFCERVNLCMGRWEPDGTTATAYIWLVWIKGRSPRAPFWIPPGCRETLTKPDDRERFTAYPVIKKQHVIETVAIGPTSARDEEPACADSSAPKPPAHADSPSDDQFNDIPDFLKIGHPDCSWRSSLE